MGMRGMVVAVTVRSSSRTRLTCRRSIAPGDGGRGPSASVVVARSNSTASAAAGGIRAPLARSQRVSGSVVQPSSVSARMAS